MFFAYPDNNSLRGMSNDLITSLVGRMSVKSNNQMKVPLVRVGFSLFSHVVARRLAEMQPTHRHFGYSFSTEFHTEKNVQTMNLFLRKKF